MPGRKFSAGSLYRYGFNGKENDNDVKGEGNQQDYGMRIYDPRVGRFFSEDPLIENYPWYTSYQFAGNTPVEAVDIDGAEEFYIIQQSHVKNKIQLDRQYADQVRTQALERLYPFRYLNKPPVPESPGKAVVRSSHDAEVAARKERRDYSNRLNENLKPANQLKKLKAAAKNFIEAPFREYDEMILSLNKGNFGDALEHAGNLALSVAPYAGALGKLARLERLGTLSADTKTVDFLNNLQTSFEKVAEEKLLPQFRKLYPNLKAGYSGSFKILILTIGLKVIFCIINSVKI